MPPDLVVFQLRHEVAGAMPQVTNQRLAPFTNLEPGEVTLWEVVPAGYGLPLVLCAVHGPDGQTFSPRGKMARRSCVGSATVQTVLAPSPWSPWWIVEAGDAPIISPLARVRSLAC